MPLHSKVLFSNSSSVSNLHNFHIFVNFSFFHETVCFDFWNHVTEWGGRENSKHLCNQILTRPLVIFSWRQPALDCQSSWPDPDGGSVPELRFPPRTRLQRRPQTHRSTLLRQLQFPGLQPCSSRCRGWGSGSTRSGQQLNYILLTFHNEGSA